MALKTYKKAGEYKIISKLDDALNLVGTEEEKLKAWEVACETGNWSALVKAGSAPVTFTLKPLGTDVLNLWRVVKRGDVQISGTEYGWCLLGRMALVRVDGSEDLKLAIEQDEDFGPVASAAPFDLLGPEMSRAIQFELGQAAFHRETVTLGK